MTRITQSDQIVLLLRQQLQKVAGRKDVQRKERTGKSAKREDAGNRVEALAALRNLPQEDVERALLRMLLIEEMGEAIGSDPKFQGIIDKVHRLIKSDRETNQLIGQALEALRAEKKG